MPEDAKVHVGNLHYEISENELRDEFEKYGTVEEVKIISDRDTGRAKGFAFVMYENVDDAKDAIAALHESRLCGRCITVDKARPRSEGGGSNSRGSYSRDRGGNYGGGGGRSQGGGRSYGGGGGRNFGGGGYGGGYGGGGGGGGGYSGGGYGGDGSGSFGVRRYDGYKQHSNRGGRYGSGYN